MRYFHVCSNQGKGKKHFEQGQAHNQGDKPFFFTAFCGMCGKEKSRQAKENEKNEGNPGQKDTGLPYGPCSGQQNSRHRYTSDEEKLLNKVPECHKTSSTGIIATGRSGHIAS